MKLQCSLHLESLYTGKGFVCVAEEQLYCMVKIVVPNKKKDLEEKAKPNIFYLQDLF